MDLWPSGIATYLQSALRWRGSCAGHKELTSGSSRGWEYRRRYIYATGISKRQTFSTVTDTYSRNVAHHLVKLSALYLFIANSELRTHPRISVLVPSSTYLRLSKVQRRTTVVAFSPHILLVYHMLNDVVQLMGPLNLVRHCQPCQNAQ